MAIAATDRRGQGKRGGHRAGARPIRLVKRGLGHRRGVVAPKRTIFKVGRRVGSAVEGVRPQEGRDGFALIQTQPPADPLRDGLRVRRHVLLADQRDLVGQGLAKSETDPGVVVPDTNRLVDIACPWCVETRGQYGPANRPGIAGDMDQMRRGEDPQQPFPDQQIFGGAIDPLQPAGAVEHQPVQPIADGLQELIVGDGV